MEETRHTIPKSMVQCNMPFAQLRRERGAARLQRFNYTARCGARSVQGRHRVKLID
jgi:hypothetical protein